MDNQRTGMEERRRTERFRLQAGVQIATATVHGEVLEVSRSGLSFSFLRDGSAGVGDHSPLNLLCYQPAHGRKYTSPTDALHRQHPAIADRMGDKPNQGGSSRDWLRAGRPQELAGAILFGNGVLYLSACLIVPVWEEERAGDEPGEIRCRCGVRFHAFGAAQGRDLGRLIRAEAGATVQPLTPQAGADRGKSAIRIRRGESAATPGRRQGRP